MNTPCPPSFLPRVHAVIGTPSLSDTHALVKVELAHTPSVCLSLTDKSTDAYHTSLSNISRSSELPALDAVLRGTGALLSLLGPRHSTEAQEALGPANTACRPWPTIQLYADLATLQTRERGREGGREGGRERAMARARPRLDSWFSTRSRGCARLD